MLVTRREECHRTNEIVWRSLWPQESKRKIQKESSTRKPQERTKDYLEIYPKVIRCNGSHTSYNGDDPVSLTKDGPRMKAWEEMRASDRQWTWYYHSVTPLRDISKLTSRKVKHDRSLPQETQRSKEILTQAVKFSKRQDKEVENPQKQKFQPMCRNDKSIGTRYPEEKSKINKRRTANRCIRLILALITAKWIDQMKFNRRM